MEFSKNVIALINYFLDKYGIKDINIPVNYLILRSAFVEFRVIELRKAVDMLSLIDEINEYREKLKMAFVRKLATERIKKLKEENEKRAEELSELTVNNFENEEKQNEEKHSDEFI